MKKLKQWRLLKKDATIESSGPTSSPQVPPPLSIYQSINNLPLSRFIDVMVDDNIYALVITGIPTIEELQKAWQNIMQEYTAAVGSNEYKVYLATYREVELLRQEYTMIHTLVQSMRNIQEHLILSYYDVPVDVLDYQKLCGDTLNNLLKTTCKFNNQDTATYEEELKKCIRRSASIKIKLDLKLIAFEAIQKKQEGGKKPDRSYFDSMLITISDHAKYEISENITVSKYCERLKRYQKYCESLKSTAHGRGR